MVNSNLSPPVARADFGDLVNLVGVRGKNTGTTAGPSEKIFNSHFIVKVNSTYTSDSYFPYFDPSYGAKYHDALDFEATAVLGYARFFGDAPPAPGERAYRAKDLLFPFPLAGVLLTP